MEARFMSRNKFGQLNIANFLDLTICSLRLLHFIVPQKSTAKKSVNYSILHTDLPTRDARMTKNFDFRLLS